MNDVNKLNEDMDAEQAVESLVSSINDEQGLTQRFGNVLTRYCGTNNGMLEMIRGSIYDTENYANTKMDDNEYVLDFFSVLKDIKRSNMSVPNILPNPMAILIQEMAISGIREYMQDGVVRVVIGNKRCGDLPLGMFYGARTAFKYAPCPMCILPLQVFRVTMQWPSVRYRKATTQPDIKVALNGIVARAMC